MRCFTAIVASLLLSIVAVVPVIAQAPDSLSFQGFVTTPGGDPINNAGIAITFKLYEGATEIWSETQPSVAIAGGVFNVLLGSVAPLDTVRFNRPLLLGIKVGVDPEISPRTPLAAAAYAKALPGLYTFYRDDGSRQSHNVVGGASNNVVGAGVVGATIGGGGGIFFTISSPNQVLDDFGTVGGGVRNTAHRQATVGGGRSNVASGSYATVGGGDFNTASAIEATVGGGFENTASGTVATVGGGEGNTASGSYATVPGGLDNGSRGFASFAAGHDAKAIHDGSFVWNDRSITTGNDSLLSTGENQFLIRAAGGVGIGTNAPSNQVSINGSTDISDSLGIGTSDLEAPLHVQINDLDVGAGEKAREGILLEKADAVLGLYSDAVGNWGSALVLAEMESNTLNNKWSVGREANAAGNDLHIKYGTDDLYENNSTRFEITNDGPVRSFGITPFSDNGGTSGTGSLRWSDVYATNGVTTTSDRRLKQDIKNIEDALPAINALRPVTFRWKSEPDGDLKLGLIAQEVETVVPEVVHAPKNDTEHYGLNYAELVPLLIKAIQEQQVIIEAQATEIDAFRTTSGDQDRRLAALEVRLLP